MIRNNKIEQIAAFLIPRLGELLFAALFAAVIGLGPRTMNIDGDLGRHLTLGSYIIDSRSIPVRDIFSFTKYGDPLTPHEWLADVIFALAHHAAGLDGVVWLTALVLAGSYWLVYRHSLARSQMSLVALAGTIAAAMAGSLHWLTRPHIFTILFTALWTMELDRFRLGLRKSWLIFPALMLLWVNLHGAFIAGFVIWAAFLVGTYLDGQQTIGELRGMASVGPIAFLVTMVNPDGLGIWKTTFGFLGNQYLVSHTAEYLPPDFQNPIFWPFLVVIVMSVLILALSRTRLSGPSLLLIGGWTAMALYSARNIPLYLIVATPILCEQAARIMLGWRDHPIARWVIDYQEKIALVEARIKGGALALVVVAAALVLLLSGNRLDFQQAGNVFSQEVFPVEAVNWMEENPLEGNGFNHFPWGGYLLYRNWPGSQVFIDGQTDFYGESLTREYEQVIALEDGFEEILDKYEIQWFLIPHRSKLAGYLDLAEDWKRIYQDQTAEIYFRGEER